MKIKTVILILLATIILLLVKNNQEKIIIPRESIRIRIISNSNKSDDIALKLKVKNNVEKELYSLLKGVKSIEEARNIINNNLENLNIIVEDTSIDKYNIKFGNNYFPEKVYKGIVYEAGEYESLIITLGEGKGNNFWCVLFPPLCLLDDNETTSDVEYKFFVKELIDKYFK